MRQARLRERKSSAFPTVNGLSGQYRIIGGELLRYEARSRGPAYSAPKAAKELREGVAFVSVEVLESYLDDLLDLDVGEERLFITRKRLHLMIEYLIVAGLLFTMGAGLYVASSGVSLTHSFGLTALLTLPFILLWYVFPRGRLARRLSFAQVISQEVSRRRGTDRDIQSPSGFGFGEILGGRGTGAVRSVFRLYH